MLGRWLIDPHGRRWKVVGWGEITAAIENERGHRVNVGRATLLDALDSGAWQDAELQEAA